MGIIKRADANAKDDVIAIDLSDIASEAARMKRHAREEAERIVRDAKAERERLIADADQRGYDEGFERGRAEGLHQGGEEGRAAAHSEHSEALSTIGEAWRAAFEGFAETRDSMLEAARVDVVRLAALVAERVTKRVVELDPDACVDQIAALLEHIAEPSKLTIRVSEGDEAVVREALPGLLEQFDLSASAEVVVDASLSHGSCELSTSDGVRFDAKLESQIARVLRAILPSEATPLRASKDEEIGEDEAKRGDLAA